MALRRSRRKNAKKVRRKSVLGPGAISAGVIALAAVPAANATTFNVTSLLDDGSAGTLRDAIQQANNAPGADVITFDSSLNGTITLNTGQLYISDDLDIQGPGASIITVSGDDSSRVFYLYNSDTTINVRIAGLTISHGVASIGGGIVDFDENLTLDGVTLTQNNAQGDGAGLWADGLSMNLSISNSTISGNIASGDGGGIYVENTGGPLLIDNCIITGNQATGNGGGIYFYDPDDAITIRDTTLSGNTASGAGGGIYLYDTDGSNPLLIQRCAISGNSAAAGGGLFFYGPDTPVTIENTTVSGNTTTEAGGGGMYFYNLYAGLHLNFVTVAENTAAGSGGGMFVGSGTPAVDNSILADNTAPADADLSGQADLRYSLIESPGSATINDIAGNIFNTDPQLGALANNGGPTQTQRPALTSPVVNAADPAFVAPPATDQRGEPRIYPTHADMGALELVGGVIQFNPTTYTVAENGGSVTLTVVRDVGPDPATVDFTTNPGTATPGAGNDYTTTASTLTFVPGDLSETFNVPILDDNVVEGPETFTATLSNPSPDASLGAGNPATVTITDFEPGQVQFSSPTYSVNESGVGQVSITVNRVNGSNGPASVNYTTTNGSATAGSDYTTTAATLNWADGDATSRTILVPILDDNIAEGNETFSISLNTPSGATIGSPAAATVTIVDDPAGTLQFSISNVNTAEEAGSVTVTVTRSGGTEGALSASYATADGTATAPSDYTPASGTVNFPAGSNAPQTFSITLVDDNIAEGQEMFSVNLTGAAVGAQNNMTVTLAASDAATITQNIPTLSIFGKLLLAMMSILVGCYAMVRNRFSMFLLAFLLLGAFAAPPLSAATPHTRQNSATHNKGEKGSRFRGTIVSITTGESTIVLNLSGGVTLTIPSKVANIVDARNAKPAPGSLQMLTQGTHVVVKIKMDGTGNVTKATIKIKP